MSSELTALGAGLAQALLLLPLGRHVRETTLTAAWWWAVAATAALVGVEASLAGSGAEDARAAAALRYVAAAFAFCPAMAALGAKRPQHRAWQFVVLSLWGVVALPGLESLVLDRGQTLALHGVRSAFLAGLIALGVLNWLPTRRWPAALLIGAGQTLLFAPHLPWIARWANGDHTASAAVLLIAGTLAANVSIVASGRRRANPADRVWRDFRDDFGALWALRVAERVNLAARASSGAPRLRWTGFVPPADGEPPATSAGDGLPMAFASQLGRFVSPSWIAKRLENDVH